jgi:4-amino-4-deoxychorismate lyase
MARSALALLNRPSAASPAHDEGAPAFALVDPAGPHISPLDLGITRGEGIFETISVSEGRPLALEAHLRRFANSAAALDLPAPDLDVWRDAIYGVIAALDPSPEAYVKTVLTPGIEGDGHPTGYAYATQVTGFEEARTTGIRVVLLDRGLKHDVARTSPWLLAGAKTLSYAVNRAAVREAKRRGADDVIFTSSDGYVLEGPTSTVLVRRGDELLTPGVGLAILDGTTQADLFAFGEQRGLRTGFALLTAEELAASDGIWLVSSVRNAAPVRELDGTPRSVDAEFTGAMNAFLHSREQ